MNRANHTNYKHGCIREIREIRGEGGNNTNRANHTNYKHGCIREIREIRGEGGNNTNRTNHTNYKHGCIREIRVIRGEGETTRIARITRIINSAAFVRFGKFVVKDKQHESRESHEL